MPTTLFKRGWFPANRLALLNLTKQPRSHEACAVFDWDNTCIFGDVGDQTFRCLLDTLALRHTPDSLEKILPQRINGRSVLRNGTALEDICRDILEAFRPIAALGPASIWKKQVSIHACTDLPAHSDFRAKCYWLYEAILKEPGDNTRLAYALQTLFWAGLRESEITVLAQSAINSGVQASIKKSSWGTQTPGRAGHCQVVFRDGLRSLQEMQDLLGLLIARGILPYIISASFEPLVKICARTLNYAVPSSHIFGMRLSQGEEDRRFAPHLDPDWPVTYRSGKVACIEKSLPEAPLLVAGDHLTDFEMLTYSAKTKLRLVIDRGLNVPEMTSLYARAMQKEPPHLSSSSAEEPLTLLQGRDEPLGVFHPDQRSHLLS